MMGVAENLGGSGWYGARDTATSKADFIKVYRRIYRDDEMEDRNFYNDI